MPDKCQTNRKKGNMARFVFVVQSFSYLHVKFNQTCSSFKYINWVYNFQSRDQKFNIVHLILTFKEKNLQLAANLGKPILALKWTYM